MVKQNAIKVFEEKKVRTLWDSETEEWYFSIVDVVAVLTDSDYQTARNYWKVLKNRLMKIRVMVLGIRTLWLYLGRVKHQPRVRCWWLS